MFERRTILNVPPTHDRGTSRHVPPFHRREAERRTRQASGVAMSLKDAVGALRSLKAELEASRAAKAQLEHAYRGLEEVSFRRTSRRDVFRPRLMFSAAACSMLDYMLQQ